MGLYLQFAKGSFKNSINSFNKAVEKAVKTKKLGKDWEIDINAPPISVMGVTRNAGIIMDAVIPFETLKKMGRLVVDILRIAQPTVPKDPAEYGGTLRESGRARLELGNRAIDIGRGKKDGSVVHMLNKITPNRTRGVKRAGINIQYVREGYDQYGNELDVAVWTHEVLNPHGGPSPAARTPGTGPKYLELAWASMKPIVYEELKNLPRDIANTLRRMGVKKRAKRGKFMVDEIELQENRLR